MNVGDLEAKLSGARERLKRLGRPTLNDTAYEEWRAAERECLDAERALSLAMGQETALQLDWAYPWDIGAPMPHVITGQGRTLLVYITRDLAPNVAIGQGGHHGERVAIVEFTGCLTVKFGEPSDELLQGSVLYGRGLAFYSAHAVANSNWLAELRRMNAAHEGFNAAAWSRLRHFLLTFHDETFECVALGYSFELVEGGIPRALDIAVQRLFPVQPYRVQR